MGAPFNVRQPARTFATLAARLFRLDRTSKEAFWGPNQCRGVHEGHSLWRIFDCGRSVHAARRPINGHA